MSETVYGTTKQIRVTPMMARKTLAFGAGSDRKDCRNIGEGRGVLLASWSVE
jgi:hypothetical protein